MVHPEADTLRTYIWYVKEGPGFEQEKIYHVYISAHPRMSMREVLAKQAFILTHLLDLPFNEELEIKVAACRENRNIPIALSYDDIISQLEHVAEIDTSAMDYAHVKLNKVSKMFDYEWDHLLEVILYEEAHISPFLDYLRKVWKGDWIQGDAGPA